MLKQFLVGLIIVTSFCICFEMHKKFNAQNANIVTDTQEVTQPVDEQYSIDIVRKYNEKVRSVRSFSAENVDVQTWRKGIRIQLNGKLFYEKRNKLAFYVDSVRGNEFYMGSNEDEFWFWSNYIDPPVQHFARHEDYHKTRLKNAFDPILIVDSLGFDEVKIDQQTIIKQKGNNTVVVRKVKNSVGEPLIKMTFLNNEDASLVGHMLTKENGDAVASSEILSYSNGRPNEILYTWNEENGSMLLKIENSSLNQRIDRSHWDRPHKRDEIDMGATSASFNWKFE